MRFLRYLVLNGIIAGMLWMGLVEGVEGARNVGIFFIWVLSVLSIFFASKEVAASISKKGFSAPYWFDVTFDLCIILLLAWYAYHITAAAYLFHMIMIGVLRNNVKEVMNETH